VGLPAWKDASAVTVVIASENYPATPRTGDVIDGVEVADAIDGVDVIHAGTARDAEGRLVTAGGRVLSVTATGATLTEARERAYEGVEFIHIPGSHHRSDIALAASRDADGTMGA
jgi:phosphoribosylamine---glycine ligase